MYINTWTWKIESRATTSMCKANVQIRHTMHFTLGRKSGLPSLKLVL